MGAVGLRMSENSEWSNGGEYRLDKKGGGDESKIGHLPKTRTGEANSRFAEAARVQHQAGGGGAKCDYAVKGTGS